MSYKTNDSNYMSQDSFTIEEALEIQKCHLKKWESIMKPEVYKKLELYTEGCNMARSNPYEIFRGTTMDNWVFNNLMNIKS